MDKTIRFKDKDGNSKEATVGGILKQGEKHPAYKKAKANLRMDAPGHPKLKSKDTSISSDPFDPEKPDDEPSDDVGGPAHPNVKKDKPKKTKLYTKYDVPKDLWDVVIGGDEVYHIIDAGPSHYRKYPEDKWKYDKAVDMVTLKNIESGKEDFTDIADDKEEAISILKDKLRNKHKGGGDSDPYDTEYYKESVR